jgi:uncharacterized protein (DUF1684 family)
MINEDAIAAIKRQRAERLANLQSSGGWLSLVGLEWLKPGANTIGRDTGNDITLTEGPGRFGKIDLNDEGRVFIEFPPDSPALVDGQRIDRAELRDDNHLQPTEVTFGSMRLFLIERSGRKALRIEDDQASERLQFKGLDYFPIDLSWQVEAQWEAFLEPKSIEILSVIGTVETARLPGRAVFIRDGQSHQLLPMQETPDSLFFVFADLTSAKETYGGGRYLDTAMPSGDTIRLDFNLARNPPCAFTPYATCPLAPPENRLNLRVTAGEKNYGHGDERE